MRLLIAATAAFLTASCITDEAAQTTREEAEAAALADPRVGEEVDSICFKSGINGFAEVKGGDGLILRRGVKDRYLVTILGSCPPLDHAQAVGTSNRFGSGGCLRRTDRLYISTSFTGRGSGPFDNDFCPIERIYTWNPDAKAEAEVDTDTEVEAEAGETESGDMDA